jgi:glycosyltransferase involved in cell wall biosynthesis
MIKKINKNLIVCYFGIHDPDFSRNRIFKKGLIENGVEVIECVDRSPGITKFFKLFSKHRKIKEHYDAMIVGYPGHVAVPLAKLVSRKYVIFDALCTMWESETFSHKASYFKQIKMKFVDWFAVKCADFVLVETYAQKKFFEKRFGGRPDKYRVVYIGADDSLFFDDKYVSKLSNFSVLFRGRLTPEAGIKYVLEAANILKDKGIFFRIIGFGILEKEVKEQINSLKLKNVELISDELSFEELRKKMLECHVSLGQFENNLRLERTIPHKCYETLAMNLPYITARTPAVSEILEDGESSLFVNTADSRDLAEKILMLKNNPDLAKKIGENGNKIYQEKFTPTNTVKDILNILR